MLMLMLMLMMLMRLLLVLVLVLLLLLMLLTMQFLAVPEQYTLASQKRHYRNALLRKAWALGLSQAVEAKG